ARWVDPHVQHPAGDALDLVLPAVLQRAVVRPLRHEVLALCEDLGVVVQGAVRLSERLQVHHQQRPVGQCLRLGVADGLLGFDAGDLCALGLLVGAALGVC
ncbi:hypothetical protein RZS08_66585, partial [Arthrospira platensis SPKY1]|nr:hypothetical protein [Arthrospira platensis SPKY1]